MDRLSDEERVALERLTEALEDLGETFEEAVSTYASLDPRGQELEGEARLDAQGLIERIAERWRQAELTGATDPRVADDPQAQQILLLLGAFEDSLILALAGDPRHRHLVLSPDEAIERMEELAALSDLDEGFVQPRAAKAPKPAEALTRRLDVLDDLLNRAMGEASGFFLDLKRDGELDEHAARERMEELAVCLRTFDVDGLAAAFAERLYVAPTLALLRTMLHAIVMRLSEDPDRRAQAIPLSELGGRIAPVVEEWKAAGV